MSSIFLESASKSSATSLSSPPEDSALSPEDGLKSDASDSSPVCFIWKTKKGDDMRMKRGGGQKEWRGKVDEKRKEGGGGIIYVYVFLYFY